MLGTSLIFSSSGCLGSVDSNLLEGEGSCWLLCLTGVGRSRGAPVGLDWGPGGRNPWLLACDLSGEGGMIPGYSGTRAGPPSIWGGKLLTGEEGGCMGYSFVGEEVWGLAGWGIRSLPPQPPG